MGTGSGFKVAPPSGSCQWGLSPAAPRAGRPRDHRQDPGATCLEIIINEAIFLLLLPLFC